MTASAREQSGRAKEKNTWCGNEKKPTWSSEERADILVILYTRQYGLRVKTVSGELLVIVLRVFYYHFVVTFMLQVFISRFEITNANWTCVLTFNRSYY